MNKTRWMLVVLVSVLGLMSASHMLFHSPKSVDGLDKELKLAQVALADFLKENPGIQEVFINKLIQDPTKPLLSEILKLYALKMNAQYEDNKAFIANSDVCIANSNILQEILQKRAQP